MENYMLAPGFYDRICRDCSFVPLLDICADVLGANSLAPFCYSTEQDSLKQHLAGVTCVCNPPYREMDRWIRKCEKAKLQDSATRVLLFIPVKKDAAFSDFVRRDAWKIVRTFQLGTEHLWTSVNDLNLFSQERLKVSNSIQTIIACTLRERQDGTWLGPSLREQLREQREALSKGLTPADIQCVLRGRQAKSSLVVPPAVHPTL